MISHTTHAPAISVILAVYNSERYLKETMESVLSQTFNDFELIIVNDGSTDKSAEILDSFARQDSRIKLFTQQNVGFGAAANRAIRESQGQYIAVMDHDDISLPRRFELQKAFLDSNPDIDGVGSQWLMITTSGEDIALDTHPTDWNVVDTLMYVYYALHHPTTMIRRKAINAVGGYREDKFFTVDYDLFMRMQLNGSRFTNLPFVLFKWRLNPTSITHTKAIQQTESLIKIRDDSFAQLLNSRTDRAVSIAKEIMHTFPMGTWQDHKISHIFPDSRESLLYKTWLNQPVNTTNEKLNRSMILWLREPQKHFQELYDQLKNNTPWLASLVAAYHGQSDILPANRLYLPKIRLDSNIQLSLFVPLAFSDSDFSERFEQAVNLQKELAIQIELIVFSAMKEKFKTSLIPTQNNPVNLVIHHDPYGWEKAILHAKGQYFAYLEENFRFNSTKFIALIMSTIKNQDDILYLIDNRYFTEAVDQDDSPLPDLRMTPKWCKATLFGNDRINLSGFIHKRLLLDGLECNLAECGAVTSRILAKHLAIRNSFEIIIETLRYYIPLTTLNDNSLSSFQKFILDWYFDYGMTCLPSKDHWHHLSKNSIENYAKALSHTWASNKLVINPSNANTIKQFYIENVIFPIRWPLFRDLVVHNKKVILTSLWNNKDFIDTFVNFLYCGFIVFRNRWKALFNK